MQEEEPTRKRNDLQLEASSRNIEKEEERKEKKIKGKTKGTFLLSGTRRDKKKMQWNLAAKCRERDRTLLGNSQIATALASDMSRGGGGGKQENVFISK